MFYGAYEHTIDDKGRITLPARFRDAFADGVVLSKSFDKCIDVLPRAAWDSSIRARLAGLDSFSREARELRRYVFTGASDCEPDKQGRVHLPSTLATHAGLEREVVIAGVDDRLEIWDRQAWVEHLTTVGGSADDVAERFASQRS